MPGIYGQDDEQRLSPPIPQAASVARADIEYYIRQSPPEATDQSFYICELAIRSVQ